MGHALPLTSVPGEVATPGSPGAPPLTGVLIPTRSEKQTLEWSLALASQEIACVLRAPTAGRGWALEVDAQEAARALRTLRLYHVENRGWRAAFVPTDSTLTFHWGALVWCFVMMVVLWTSEAANSRLVETGAMLSAQVARGEWWRPVTATFLHAGSDHLAANLATGFVLLGLAMGRYGPGTALLTSLLAGVAGYVSAGLFRSYDHPGVGASGVVMAALGMLAVSMVADVRAGRLAPGTMGRGILGGVALFLLLGTSPRSDVLAHAGGFVWGALLATVLSILPVSVTTGRRFEVTCAAAYLVVGLAAWIAALR